MDEHKVKRSISWESTSTWLVCTENMAGEHGVLGLKNIEYLVGEHKLLVEEQGVPDG